MSFKGYTALAAAVCASASFNVSANNHHDEMVVTANRVEQSLDTVLVPVTVMNRARIEEIQANTVFDILRQVPGLQLARRGGKGGRSGIFLRGTNTSHVLILVDGVRFDSATTGEAAIEAIGVDQIERIEVVRGPRSSLYGSEAIGGVIQIFTRKGHTESDSMVTVGYGSEDTRELGVYSNFGYANGAVVVSASGSQTDGIDSQYQDDEWTGDAKYDLDDDKNEARDLSIRWSHKFSEGLKLDWSNYYSQDESHYDETACQDWSFPCALPESSLPYSETQNGKSSLGLDADITEMWNVNVQVAYAIDDLRVRNENNDLDENDQIKTERYHHTINNKLALSENQTIVLGIEYLQDLVESDNDYEKDERENIGTYAQYMLSAGIFSMSVGGRYDDNDQFGGHETGNISLGLGFSPAFETILSLGTAFKAPTFNDLYWPGAGNPDLEPEESKNIELQFRGDIGEQSYYEVNIFENKIDNLIQWAPIDPSNPFSQWQPQNVAEARIKGIELVYQTATEWVDLAFNATYIEPKDVSQNEDLRRRSRLVGSIDVSRSGKDGKLGLTIHGVGEKKGVENLPGYGTVDIRMEKNLSESLIARLKVENLFDKQYVQVEKYNDQGRYAFLELEYKFKH